MAGLCKASKRQLSFVSIVSRQTMEAKYKIMPAGSYSCNFILPLLVQVIFALLLAADAVQISEEENLEMERQLKIINKPPIKSFRTEYGDILDCINIYKQHAFDHPLLKDHKVQMRPTRIPKDQKKGGKSSMKTEPPRFLPKHVRCPPGSVLIKRTTKEDIIMAKKMKALGLNYPTSSPPNPKNFAAAFAECTMHNFGAKTTLNVWNPSVSRDQFSLASIWIVNGPIDKINVIQFGWEVQPRLYSSNYTRLFTFWSVDSYRTICYDYLCPGFVQVSDKISLGLVLKQISAYNGTQADIEISIFKDGEWWLKFYNQIIGYWPKKLFYYMYGGANYVLWGGQILSPANEPAPPMGSGHLPQDGHYGKSAYFKQTQIFDNVNFVNPNADSIKLISDRPKCYSAEIAHEEGDPNSVDLFFGGPGKC